MKNNFSRLAAAGVFIILTISLLISCSEGLTQSTVTSTVYIPTVFADSLSFTPPVFGVQVSSLSDTKVLSATIESDSYWLRLNALKWSSAQPNGPEDNPIWDTNLDQDLIRASSNGLEVILIVRSTPTWAQQIPGYKCGPIKPEQLPEFANFLSQVVKRYSVPPFNVSYYEIWNEPDVDYQLVPDPNTEFGCWGNKDDEYYGGSEYANMLKSIYPVMKAANPDVQVVVGGLLLDCDPTNIGKGYCPTEEQALSMKFFEGILRDNGMNDGANFFDIVSFHGYPQPSATSPIQSEINYPTWSNSGGVVQGKISFLRSVMASYLVDKPIMQTEAAYITQGKNSSDFEQNKAEYVVWLFTRNMSQGLLGTTWYTLDGPGWRNGGLLDANQDPLPAYNAYRFMISELINMRFIEEDKPTPNVTRFSFGRQNIQLQVYFSMDGVAHPITAPTGWTAIYDLFGTPIYPTPTQDIIIQYPVYVEIGQ
jgi:hypothetical protein